MRTHEEMRDDRGWLVRQQLGTEPLHLDMAVRAGRCFEMLGGVSETINHGSLAFTEVIAEYPLSVCNKRHSARARPVDRSGYSRLSATLATVWSAPFFRIRVARGRVGRMLSSRLARLVRSQIAIAVAVASSSDNSA